jgi:hypothetical protein
MAMRSSLRLLSASHPPKVGDLGELVPELPPVLWVGGAELGNLPVGVDPGDGPSSGGFSRGCEELAELLVVEVGHRLGTSMSDNS